MKFGQIPHIEDVDFSLPPTPLATTALLEANKTAGDLAVYIGLPKFNKKDLKELYPEKVKDDLAYYASQFNAIEFNATFYKTPSKEQVVKWKEKTGEDFLFFPKIPQSISHYSRLLRTKEKVLAYCDAIALFEERLGCSFLQLHDNFKSKDAERLLAFIADFPIGYPLAVELRNSSWFEDKDSIESIFKALTARGMSTVLVDTPGRRDVLHMRLTAPLAFIRFVACGDAQVDCQRLQDWVVRIQEWKAAGLQELCFFIHQQHTAESINLAAYLKERLQAI